MQVCRHRDGQVAPPRRHHRELLLSRHRIALGVPASGDTEHEIPSPSEAHIIRPQSNTMRCLSLRLPT